MRVLFAFKGVEWPAVELLSAIARRAGHQTELIFEPGIEATGHLPFRMPLRGRIRRGMLGRARAFRPDVVLLSSTTYSYRWMKEAAAWLKRALGVPILAGGQHASLLPARVLRSPGIDYVCVGEGDEAVPEFLDAMERGGCADGIPNIWMKGAGGEIVPNEPRNLIDDLDSLPFPDKDLFYRYGCFTSNAYVMTSRGCPRCCTFCGHNSGRRLYRGKGRYYRRHSVDYALDMVGYYRKRYRLRRIHFYDDIFTHDLRWLSDFCERYPRSVGLPFYCLSTCRDMSDEAAEMLASAGCRCVALGVEAGDDHVRNDTLGKDLSIDRIEQAFAALRRHRIKSVSFNMFGMPGETDEQMWRTLELNLRLRPTSLFSFVFYAYPGLTITDRAREGGFIGPAAWRRLRDGEGSSQDRSLLTHPFAHVAGNLKAAAPIVNKLPPAVGRRLRGILLRKLPGFVVHALQVLSLPLLSCWEVPNRIQEQAGILWNLLTGWGKRRVG